MRWLTGVFLIALVAGACGSAAPDPQASDLAVLVDQNPDPGVVEVELVAAPGMVELLADKPADVWAFRDGSDPDATGSVPGPMLQADVGSQVIVHFRNDLPDATTIHWHGLRVPNAADGTPAAQVPVPPGGSYDYVFTVREPGLYWYHPHIAADVQIERGLYAPIVVRGGVAPDVAADRVFVLDDVKLEASGQLSTTTDGLDIMLGRQGNVVLVNGRRRPAIAAAAGSRERWRFVDTANGRYFRLALAGHPFRVIGWDGGPLRAPYLTDSLLIAPGERYDVLVELDGDEGETLVLQNLYYDRGHDIPDAGPLDLLDVRLGGAGPAPAPLPAVWGEVEPIGVDATTPHRALVLAETEGAEPTFSINGERYPDITAVAVTDGAVEIWDLRNDAEMDHPFHLHGTEFQLVGDGPPLGWKDTVNVPRRSDVSIAVRFDALGRWMYHCHILEHAERGMMGEIAVSRP